MIDYTIYYKERFRPEELMLAGSWDVLLSAYDQSTRAQAVFDGLQAVQKKRFALPEYGFSNDELPADVQRIERGANDDEATVLSEILTALGDLDSRRLCVDISGFISNYVLVLLRLLYDKGINKFDVVYAEPIRYKQKEETRFSDEVVLDVKQLPGYEGVHDPDTTSDLLVLNVGYDHKLVAEVANQKEHSKKVQVFGLPSLMADMYQENLLRARHAAEALGGQANLPENYRFAPASDPFVTAAVVAEIVRAHRAERGTANVYLAPLSTKAQTLGVGLYFLSECVRENVATSVIYPSYRRHERETSDGVSGLWRFSVELPR
jgi:hypothetical protein